MAELARGILSVLEEVQDTGQNDYQKEDNKLGRDLDDA
jgi:hypothetical protein